MPKAWCRFDGTAADPITPDADVNVTDVTDNGTGDYTINFTTALANANYAIAGMSTGSRFVTATTLATTSARIAVRNDGGSNEDSALVTLIVMGTQS